MYWIGIEGDYTVMVMDLLGPNLEDLYTGYKKRFSIQTSLSITKHIVIYSLTLIALDNGVYTFQELYTPRCET